jgi:hypothetical protein
MEERLSKQRSRWKSKYKCREEYIASRNNSQTRWCTSRNGMKMIGMETRRQRGNMIKGSGLHS